MINKQDKQDKYIDLTLKAIIILCLTGLLISMTNLFLKLKSKENKYINQIEMLEERIFNIEIENAVIFDENVKLRECCSDDEGNIFDENGYEKIY